VSVAPGADPAAHERRYEQLRARVIRLHADAVALDPVEPALPAEPADAPEPAGPPEAAGQPEPAGPPDERLVATVDELVEATDALLALEDRLPVLRDLPARASSVQVVRASALATLLGGVLLGLSLWHGALAFWWVPVLALMLPGAARLATLTVAPAAGRHRRQRWAAAVTGASALLAPPVAAVFGWLPGLACVAVLAAALAVVFDVRWGRG